jgi:tetratricopeptide (TPR) repeat protein
MPAPPADRKKRERYYNKRYNNEAAEITAATLDAEYAFAEQCFDADDLERGLNAVAVVLAFDPFRTDATALLGRFFDTAQHEVTKHIGYPELAPYRAAQVLDVFAASRRGEWPEVFDKLTDLCTNDPSFLLPEAWGLDWLTKATLKSLELKPLARFFTAFANGRYPEPADVSPWGREQLGRTIKKASLVEAAHGRDDNLTLIKCQMLSKAGRSKDAIREAEAEAKRNPTFLTATAAAMAHKRAGDIDSAVGWFRKSAELDHTNETALLDIGDLMIDAGNHRAALAAYEEALRRVPNHDWAIPSAAFCRYMVSKSADHLEELRKLALGDRCTCGCADMFGSMFGGYNYEDRWRRAEALLQRIEPGFDSAAVLAGQEEAKKRRKK